MTTHRPARTLPVAIAALLVAVLAVLLTSCGGGGEASSSSGAAEPAAVAQGNSRTADQALTGAGPDATEDSKAADEAASGTGPESFAGAAGTSKGTSPASPASDRSAVSKRVRTGEIGVQVSDLRAAAARVRATAERLGGSVASEDIRSTLPGSPAGATMTLRVPEPKLDEAMDAAGAAGKELSRSATSDDVTATLADLESREASQQASVDRIRTLMGKASSLQDVVLLESELSRREADLEAAQASRRALADQAAQATLTVSLTTTAPVAVREPDDDGFMAGLRGSWHAVQKSTTVLLTVLGAVLPVGLALAVIGWPAYLVVRRIRRPKPAPAGPAVPVVPAP